MKTLKTIQVLSKIGKILSKIIFIFCIIGFCSCIVCILSMALGAPTLKIGGVTLGSILNTEAEVTVGTVYAAMATGMILCAGEAVLAKFAEHYFKRELADGTPFTFAGAKEMQRLGILTICLPIGTQIIAEIVHAVMEQTMQGVAPLRLKLVSYIVWGLAGAIFLLQPLINGARSADITDVITNTTGGLIGYMIYRRNLFTCNALDSYDVSGMAVPGHHI